MAVVVAAIISSIFVVVLVMVTVSLGSALPLHHQGPQARTLQAKLKFQVGSTPLRWTEPCRHCPL